MESNLFERAILIRSFEEKLLELFALGKLAGTVHTCIGQEIGAVAVARELRDSDWVFSNHRCHGHYLALKPNVKGLLAEIMGRPEGICAGRGGSQHICDGRFFSNGIQGGGLPIAAGCGLAEAMTADSQSIAVAFIGDGTLGQGVLYESLNLAAKWSVPWLIVLEHNGYAQSTDTGTTIAGDIAQRFAAFGWKIWSGTVWNPEALVETTAACVGYVRGERKPAVLIIESYRLKAHSKGDDNRAAGEVAAFLAKDPLVVFEREQPELARAWRAEAETLLARAEAEIEAAVPVVVSVSASETQDESAARGWEPLAAPAQPRRLAEHLREALGERLAQDETVVVIGEDVEDPYGGAFKVTKGLSSRFPGRVRNTPISEAAIAGLGNGLAMAGRRPIVEIMFGDFVTLIADQVINQATKFSYIYNEQVGVPVIYRTPMGGRRGYGATHSQSLEKVFFGTPGLRIVAINEVVDPVPLLRSVQAMGGPCLWLENKVLYANKLRHAAPSGLVWTSDRRACPTLRLALGGGSDVTVVTYGGMVADVERAAQAVFLEQEVRCELLVPTQIQPLDFDPILESVRRTRRLVVVEEGQGFAGFGAEVMARCAERLGGVTWRGARCHAADHPIPCARDQENQALPQAADIVQAIQETFAS